MLLINSILHTCKTSSRYNVGFKKNKGMRTFLIQIWERKFPIIVQGKVLIICGLQC